MHITQAGLLQRPGVVAARAIDPLFDLADPIFSYRSYHDNQQQLLRMEAVVGCLTRKDHLLCYRYV